MNKETSKKPAERDERELVEQEAPEKNTDKAFVKVGTDGQPEIPKETKTEKQEEGSLRHR